MQKGNNRMFKTIQKCFRGALHHLNIFEMAPVLGILQQKESFLLFVCLFACFFFTLFVSFPVLILQNARCRWYFADMAIYVNCSSSGVLSFVPLFSYLFDSLKCSKSIVVPVVAVCGHGLYCLLPQCPSSDASASFPPITLKQKPPPPQF